MCYAKVILNVYPQIDRVIKDMDKLVLSRCLASFNDRMPCEMGIKEVYKLMETKQKLVDLRFKIKKVLERLDPEEYDLIDYKYFKNRHIDGFDHTSRNYFRRQHKVIERLEELLSYIDLSEDKFKRDYYDIPFIRAIADASRYENAG